MILAKQMRRFGEVCVYRCRKGAAILRVRQLLRRNFSIQPDEEMCMPRRPILHRCEEYRLEGAEDSVEVSCLNPCAREMHFRYEKVVVGPNQGTAVLIQANRQLRLVG